MKVITGEIIKTSFGEMLVYNEQTEHLSVGEKIIVGEKIRTIKSIQAPTKPESKWAIQLNP
ncbi:MAG: hypothetical protein IJI14_06170 [Anaerolineaceae bacterium]|nr:hypothetical protein [Anaerolineaceae bacterium]